MFIEWVIPLSSVKLYEDQLEVDRSGRSEGFSHSRRGFI